MIRGGIPILLSGLLGVAGVGCTEVASVREGQPGPALPAEAAPRKNPAAGEDWPSRLSVSQKQPIPKEGAVKATPIPLPEDAALRRLVVQAREDLAGRLRMAPEKIDLVELRSVVWPDKRLGCPRPGMAYPQVQVDGLLIRFSAQSRIFQYHGGGGRAPFLRSEERRVGKECRSRWSPYH